MAEPGANDVQLDARFQKVDGGRMSNRVGRYPALVFAGTGSYQFSCMSFDDLIDTKASEGLVSNRNEQLGLLVTWTMDMYACQTKILGH